MNFSPYPFALRGAASVLPPQLSCLRGRIDRSLLRRATERLAAESSGAEDCPVAALIADGIVGENFYYKALAAHLDLPFRDDWPDLGSDADGIASVRTWAVPLGAGDRSRWLVAPQGEALRRLLLAPRANREGIAIATPAHLAALLQFRQQALIERVACDALPNYAPRFSAKGIAGPSAKAWIGACLAATLAAWILVPQVPAILLGALFAAGLLFKLRVATTALRSERRPAPAALSDADLPIYSVLVPLRDEAEIVPQLIEALQRLDYPRAKLDVLLLVEPEDRATRAALASCRLPPWLRVVFGPVGGTLRTKPRALNIGLRAARGSLLTVFDAEDRPEPRQLRAAAARFASAPPSLACLQAALAIDNGEEGWLPRCFAVEYATLFDILNVGLTRLALPIALGGTSNHFRTSSLKAAGGWDAWNVTEDADLGLRLARLGYQIDSLASTTWEAAPRPLGVWMKQRRRWTKGWMQTLLVLVQDAPAVGRALGARRSAALVLCLTNLLLGPLLYPLVCARFLVQAFEHEPGGGLLSSLFAGLFALGLVSAFWCGEMALRRRPSAGRWPTLLLLPAYQMLVGIAGWMGLVDLWRAPHHWHKTAHPRIKLPHRRPAVAFTGGRPAWAALISDTSRMRLSFRHRA